jgi:hypothetical protein
MCFLCCRLYKQKPKIIVSSVVIQLSVEIRPVKRSYSETVINPLPGYDYRRLRRLKSVLLICEVDRLVIAL